MTNYEEDDLEEVDGNEPLDEAEAAPAANNRSFLLALGVLGAILLLGIIGLVILFLNNRNQAGGAPGVSSVEQTNVVIMTANAATAGAATESALTALAPTATLPPTNTMVPPTATNTQVVALATATATLEPGAAAQAIFTATASPTQNRTGTVPAALTQSAGQTRTQSVNLTATATRLPQSGFAEDVGLPGLFGMALGLVLLIVLVRRLRLSTSS